MLRITVYTTLVVILVVGAASAQTDKQGLPGYSNAARTDAEKKNSDPWGDVRPAPPAAAKNKQ